MKKLEENLPTKLEDILNRKFDTETEPLFARQDADKSDLLNEIKAPPVPAEIEVVIIPVTSLLECRKYSVKTKE